MSATDGHVLDLLARPDVDAETVKDVRRHLSRFLGVRLMSIDVVDDQTLRLHVDTASPITALAAIRACLRALGCEDRFFARTASLETFKVHRAGQ